MNATVLAVLLGAVLAAAYTLSPLTMILAALAPWLFVIAGRGLSAREARWLWTVLGAALLLRAAAIAAMLLVSDHDAQATVILSGDEAYSLSRSFRNRNMILGFPGLKYDYQIALEDYGETSYLTLLTVLQVLFGPSPYALRLLNVLVFLTGAAIIFHFARTAFGRLPAFAALVGILFLPTLFLWSVSLLKEAIYFALAATVLSATYAAASRLTRGRTLRDFAVAIALVFVVIGALWTLRGLRTGAVALVGGGVATGLVLYIATANARRMLGAALLAIVAAMALASQDGVRDRVSAGLLAAAKTHVGHVFTVGHPYKTLDEGFYVTVDANMVLTNDEAARYVIRSIASFLVVPWPWQMATRSELVFLPEHLLWCVGLLLAPIGLVAAAKRDRLAAALIVGITVPAGLVVALTNGNVGTLIRFRGLVWPYVMMLIAVGASLVLQRLLTSAPMERGLDCPPIAVERA